MTNVLVCVKRVPDSSGEVLLSADAQSVDARFVGFTVSPHESCAVELAVKIAEAGAGDGAVLLLLLPVVLRRLDVVGETVGALLHLGELVFELLRPLLVAFHRHPSLAAASSAAARSSSFSFR